MNIAIEIPKQPVPLPRMDEETGKPYISYSQHSKWKTKPKEYIRQYFLGEPFTGNAYTEFGSKVGGALENNNFEGFEESEIETLLKVPRLEEFERKVILDFERFFVLGYIDSNDKLCTELIDYKTGGEGKENEYSVDSYDQLALYAGGLWQETGKKPERAKVVFIERLGNAYQGEPLMVGEKVLEIPKDISPERIAKACKDILKSVREISVRYKVLLKFKKVIV